MLSRASVKFSSSVQVAATGFPKEKQEILPHT